MVIKTSLVVAAAVLLPALAFAEPGPTDTKMQETRAARAQLRVAKPAVKHHHASTDAVKVKMEAYSDANALYGPNSAAAADQGRTSGGAGDGGGASGGSE